MKERNEEMFDVILNLMDLVANASVEIYKSGGSISPSRLRKDSFGQVMEIMVRNDIEVTFKYKGENKW